MRGVIGVLLFVVLLSGFVFAGSTSESSVGFYVGESSDGDGVGDIDEGFCGTNDFIAFGIALVVILVIVVGVLRGTKKKRVKRRAKVKRKK